MTVVLVALATILVMLVLVRINARARTTLGASARPNRDRRSGRDRRVQRVYVPRERRRAPRRFEDVASAYVARVDRSRLARGHRLGSRG
jgi:hypothetical protein